MVRWFLPGPTPIIVESPTVTEPLGLEWADELKSCTRIGDGGVTPGGTTGSTASASASVSSSVSLPLSIWRPAGWKAFGLGKYTALTALHTLQFCRGAKLFGRS